MRYDPWKMATLLVGFINSVVTRAGRQISCVYRARLCRFHLKRDTEYTLRSVELGQFIMSRLLIVILECPLDKTEFHSRY
jgi:hypothetical protein